MEICKPESLYERTENPFLYNKHIFFYQLYFINVECSTQYYGSNCSTPCGQCTGEDVCDNVTGLCPSGCKHNWNGTKCDG